MLKKAQLQLSFGMIFSLILIIATLATVGYVLIKLFSTDKSIVCSTFYDSIQSGISNAWNGDGATRDIVTFDAPSKVSKVCFGNLSLFPDISSRQAYESIKFFSKPDSNIFLYSPDKKVCGDSPTNKRLDYLASFKFFCINVKDGKLAYTLSKNSNQLLVTISP